MSPVLEARGLEVRFRVPGGPWGQPRVLTAVEGVGFELRRGETLGVVGESGCGKSTLGRALLGLVPLSAGSVWLEGVRFAGAGDPHRRQLRKRVQMVFQDPQGSLDPRMTVAQSVAEPLEIFEPLARRRANRARVVEALRQVGLDPGLADRYPHELSGGQCQRVGIARAMILGPTVIVCDEPVSALDVSVQGQVVNLLAGLRDKLGLALVFISHNLAVVHHLSTSVLVMYLGRPMELGPSARIHERPLHPYTRVLLDAVPSPDPGAPPCPPLIGDLPSPLEPPDGCPFSTRCPRVIHRCRMARPALEPAGAGHLVACHRWREWEDGLVGRHP